MNITDTSIALKVEFKNPLEVSQSEKPDLIYIKFAPIFVSQGTNQVIDSGSLIIKSAVPKQF
jgi:hypothetical protein